MVYARLSPGILYTGHKKCASEVQLLKNWSDRSYQMQLRRAKTPWNSTLGNWRGDRGNPTLPAAHRRKEDWLKLGFWGSAGLLWDSPKHRDTISLSLGFPPCSQDRQQSGQNGPGLPITRLPPGGFLQLNTNPKSPTGPLACFPWLQKLCLVNLASQPLVLYLSAEMSRKCKTHQVHTIIFALFKFYFPWLELRESKSALGIRAHILPSDGQSSLSKRSEWHHFFVQEKTPLYVVHQWAIGSHHREAVETEEMKFNTREENK